MQAYLQITVTREWVVKSLSGGEPGWFSERTAPPAEGFRTASVWDAMRADGGAGGAVEAQRLGLELGAWLYDAKAAAMLWEHAMAAPRRSRWEGWSRSLAHGQASGLSWCS